MSLNQTSHFYAGLVERKEEDSLLQPFSVCRVCRGWSGGVLILPCSHPMCARCLEAAAAAERARSKGGPKPGLDPCVVLCSDCKGPIELPCWTWSSVMSCLPECPTLSPEERGALCQDVSKTQGRTRWADGGVDLQEEEMEQSVFGLRFALDSSHVPSSICVSNSSLTATCRAQSRPKPAGASGPVQPLAELSTDIQIRQGQYYWEVDVCNSALYRIGVRSVDRSCGWWFERRGFHFSAVYDGTVEPVHSVPPGIKTIGLFLNMNGGALSYFNALSQEHLVTLPTRFDPAGVVPALALGQGRLKLHTGLAPPPLVFHSKDSRYRGPQSSDGGVWRRGVAFGSIRKVVEKFEELALSQ